MLSYKEIQKITEEFFEASTPEKQKEILELSRATIASANRASLPLSVRFEQRWPNYLSYLRGDQPTAKSPALRSAGLQLKREAQNTQRRRHLAVACPYCKAFAGMLCVTVEGSFPGREQYAVHASRQKAAAKPCQERFAGTITGISGSDRKQA